MKTTGSLSAAPWVAILTFALFFTLPRQFHFITFALPAVYSCIIFSKNGRSFNVTMFLLILISAVLVPSGFFTLDVAGNTILPSAQPTLTLIFSFLDFINIFVVVFVFVLPIGMIVMIVIDIINPLKSTNYESVMSGLMKAVLVILFFFIGCIVLDFFGLLPEWFVWHYIRDFFIWLIQIFDFLGQSIQALFTGQLFPAAPAFPNLGSQSLGQIVTGSDVLFPTLSASGDVAVGSLPWIFVNVSAAIPLILAIASFGIWFMQKRDRKPYLWINRYLGEKTDDLKLKLVKFNAPAIIFGAAVLVYAFFTFLTFSDSSMDLGLYTVITVFCIIIITIGILPVKTGNFLKTIEGIAIGTGGIFFFYNVLSTGLSTSPFPDKNTFVKVLDQIFFTGSTESLIFHVVIPGLAMLCAYYIYRHFSRNRNENSIEKKIAQLEGTRAKLQEIYQQTLTHNSNNLTYLGESYSTSQFRVIIFNIGIEIEVLKSRDATSSTITLNTLIFSKIQYTTFVIAFCFLVPNIIFSSFHSIRTNYDFLAFWGTGLGFVYLGSGCWLTFITIRYGWLPCILSHACINIISIILMGVYI